VAQPDDAADIHAAAVLPVSAHADQIKAVLLQNEADDAAAHLTCPDDQNANRILHYRTPLLPAVFSGNYLTLRSVPDAAMILVNGVGLQATGTSGNG
jgi:hypothetical protein